ncbi:MAG: hypothetical protein QF544_03680 [Candidatus Thalassarchaeaceae archaeon]|nr:hypothetical protein [Candidatus Thalassarchaeaceae archaeon]
MLIEEYLLTHYWLPLFLLPLGIGMAIATERGRRLAGCGLLLLIAIAIISHPERLDASSEGWSLHLLISLIGPIVALLFGIWFALFSGPIPVAPMPRNVRPFGFALMILSLSWFCWMLFEARPALDGVPNPWWQHLATGLLTSMIIIAGFAAAFVLVMGDERKKEAVIMSILSLASFLLLIYLLAEGTTSDDPVFWRSSSWGTLGDLGGMLFGGGFALMLFVTLVWLGEKRMAVPSEVEPLSIDESARVKEILKENLEGGA